jgi:predicted DNA-binding protein
LLKQPSVKLRKELWERVKRCAGLAGYSSPEEFVEHIIERELAKLEDAETDEQIINKLKGLGYLQ